MWDLPDMSDLEDVAKVPDSTANSKANTARYTHSLFYDKTLSDVQIKLKHGQLIFAHRAV